MEQNKTVTESVEYIAVMTLRPDTIAVQCLSDKQPVYVPRNEDVVEFLTDPNFLSLMEKVADHYRYDDRNLTIVRLVVKERKVRVTTEIIE